MEHENVFTTRTITVYKRMQNILKASAVGNIILFLIVLCLYVAHQSVSGESLGSEAICITCDFRVKDLGSTLYDYITTTESNTNLCCFGNDSNQQDIILKLAASGQRQYNYGGPYDQKLKWWTERNYAAHLYADRITNNNRLTWTAGRYSTSFVRNLTLSSRNTLTVPDGFGAGIYFVYSLFTFDFRNKTITGYGQTIRHMIMKIDNSLDNGYEKKIFDSTTGDKHIPTRKTTYLGGVVSLNRSDVIFVRAYSMSQKDVTMTEKYIDVSSPYYNYFGIFKLD